MKVANPPSCKGPAVVVVHTSKPQSADASEQTADASLQAAKNKSTFWIHAYSRAGVIKPDAYSRSLLRSAKKQKLDCAGCNAAHSLGIDHCHKHDGDKYGKGPQKRLRR